MISAQPRMGRQAQAAVPADEQEFAVLVAPHTAVLTAIAARLVGNADASDVVQEGLLRAWRRWSTFNPTKGTLRVWLAAIVVDRARRHRLARPQREASRHVQLTDHPSDESDHTQRLVIEAAVRSLPRRQPEVVALYYLADLSLAETAEALGLRRGSVKAHLSAARAKLKTAMES